MRRMAMNQSLSESDLSVSGGDEFSDSSSTSDEGSTVCSSSSSSSDNNSHWDALELAKFKKDVLRLPRGLCENPAIFHEFFSMHTWNMLPENWQQRLGTFLPCFQDILQPQEAILERERSIEMLFNGQLQCFRRSPLSDLQQQLEVGNHRPDVLQLKHTIAKSRRREQRFQRCQRISVLAKHLFISRERLFRRVFKSAPETVLRLERNIRREHAIINTDSNLCTVRSRKRFQQEMEHLMQKFGLENDEMSVDEDSDNEVFITEEFNRNSKSEPISAIKAPTTSSDRYIYSTHFKRRNDLTNEESVRADQHAKQPRLSNRNLRTFLREHKRRKLTEPTLPEFETADIRLRDVCARAQMGNNFKHLFGVGKAPGRKPKSKRLPTNEPPALVPIQAAKPHAEGSLVFQSEPATEQHTAANKPVSHLQGDFAHEKVSQEKNSNSELQHQYLAGDGTAFNVLDGEVDLQQEEVETYTNSEEAMPRFVISSDLLPAIEHNNVPPQKLLQTPHKDEHISRTSNQLRLLDNLQTSEPIHMPKLEPITIHNKTSQREKLRQLQNKNSTAISIATTVKKQAISAASNNKTTSQFKYNSNELIQETHSCFFALLRDFFCATPNHRMQYNDLKEHVEVWLCNPITALNDWYSQAENWSMLLTSAINFLAGDYADQPDEYVPYIEFKPQQNIYQWIGAGRDSDTRLSTLCTYWLQRRKETCETMPALAHQTESAVETDVNTPCARGTVVDAEENIISYDGGVSPPPPPPPRCPTTWTVCAATPLEVIEFQRQERERFEQPHRAYTYRMHGYESVVGPVKGIYTQMYALTKARGHSMMVGNRPNFVTILTLVRDATARLPNGEGTRADIAELLKSSQYINLKEGENVLQTTVSGALDRMHTENDPCVRYDPKRKIWIYLHRNRTEEDFERIHQQFQGIGKVKKVVQRKQKSKGSFKTGSDVNDLSNISATEGENGFEAVNTQKTTLPFSMPALVPANSIIVSSQNNMAQKVIVKPSPSHSLPVPPLKYNIPHQQQKSLLKSTMQMQRKQEAKTLEVSSGIENPNQLQHQQRNQVRVYSSNKTHSTGADGQTAVSANVTSKQFSFTVPQAKCSNTIGNTGLSANTPILLATPGGLQTVHVPSATVDTASTVTTATTTPSSTKSKQNSPVTATVGGKKVALNKPIIINQINTQPLGIASAKSKSTHQILRQQINASQNPQTHGYIIPIGIANNAGNREPAKLISTAYVEDSDTLPKEVVCHVSASNPTNTAGGNVYMTNSQLLATDVRTSLSGSSQLKQQQQTQIQSPSKNIIRLVPAIGDTGPKTLIPTTSSVGTKQPVHVIGHRVVPNNSGNLRPQLHLQPQKISNISLISGSASGAQSNNVSSIVTATSGSTLIKMSPQAFATLQQKQGQHILFKQTQAASNQQQQHQQRVVVGNTAIISQSSGIQQSGKKIIMQQTPVGVATHKLIGSKSPSVTLQTSSSTPVTGKSHPINPTNLTPHQQRILMQNIKQQQQSQTQQIHFKTVQMVPHVSTTPQTQPNQTHIVTRPQLSSGTVATSQGGGKPVTVMVSQSQGLTRVLKSNVSTPQAQQQQQTITITNEAPTTTPTGGTRVLSTATGQILSLESLLQKQGGALKVSGSTVRAVTKGAQTGAMQPQILTTGNTTYTVSPQAVSGGQQRSSSTQVTLSPDQITKSAITANSGSAGTIVMSPGGQLSTQQIAKVIGKGTNTTPGTNIRVIKNSGSARSFNIASLQNKQVVFAAKPVVGTKNLTSITNASQSQILQTGSNVLIGGQTVKLQRSVQQQTVKSGSVGVITSQSSPMQTVIMGNQILRVQQLPSQTVKNVTGSSTLQQRLTAVSMGNVVSSGASGSSSNAAGGTIVVNNGEAILSNTSTSISLPKTLMLGAGGQTIRLQQQTQPPSVSTQSQAQTQTQPQLVSVKSTTQQATKAGNANRVVLAVQGGGQIFLSPSFQGSTLNLKSLQNMKVVSLNPKSNTAGNSSSGSNIGEAQLDDATSASIISTTSSNTGSGA